MDAAAGVMMREPLWLAGAVLAIPLGVWLVARARLRRRLAARFVSERLRGDSLPARSLRPIALAAAAAFTFIGLAGPRFGFETRMIDVSTHNRVLALDLSNSMLARDVGVSRLDAAKSLLQRIVHGSGGRVALVVFEQRAEVIAPLTPDGDAVASLLETLSAGETAEGGSDIGEGVRTAISASEVAQARISDVVVVSDGEDQGNSLDIAINDARRRGVRVHAIMIGTAEGATIPTANGPLRDEEGVEVTTHASASALKRLASETGGEFFANPFSGPELARLERALQRRADAATGEREVQIPIERFQWPLALAFLAALTGSFLHRGAS